MNYLSVRDVPAYSTSQLFADLGGCLGLYIGVSLITILEVFELLKSIIFIIRSKLLAKTKIKASSHIEEGVVELHWVAAPPSKPLPVIYQRNKQCCGRISTSLSSKRQNNTTTTGLSPGCVSPLRQLP
ncbi:Amiloride-sensitive cation channel 2-A, neuronal, partial [Stegodyphus mimosarum]